MKKIIIHDTTLRDGNHAISHQLSSNSIESYCTIAERAGIPVVEVGHGNGLGASSLQVGFSKCTDEKMLLTARNILKKTKLAVHVMPGFATIKDDLTKAIDIGVDIIRVGTHCTEADISKNFVEFSKKNGVKVYGALMMSHMVDKKELLKQAKLFQEYGASGVSIFDSAGNYITEDVKSRISYLVKNLSIQVGFHGHNNLGLAIANSITAIENGATIIDSSIKGFGAGAGNAQLEVLVAVLQRMKYQTGIDLYSALDASELAMNKFIDKSPTITSSAVISGLTGVFSGFNKHIEKVAAIYDVDPRKIYAYLGKAKIIGGQEDKIVEAANWIKNNEKSTKTKNK